VGEPPGCLLSGHVPVRLRAGAPLRSGGSRLGFPIPVAPCSTHGGETTESEDDHVHDHRSARVTLFTRGDNATRCQGHTTARVDRTRTVGRHGTSYREGRSCKAQEASSVRETRS